jgi:hypothetical protein
MTNPDIPKIEELANELALWTTYREIRRARGIDIVRIYQELAAEQKNCLISPGGREDFAELCEDGCFPIALAAIVALIGYAPVLGGFWTEIVGNPDNREKIARNLENAAQSIESLFGQAITLEKEGKETGFTKIGRLPFSQIVSELRFYIRFINFAQSFSADTEMRSPIELGKYLLTSYVKRMTGRFHDRSVSTLVGEITNSVEYNEVAHRMWRMRNYRRIEKHFSWITRFLVAMSVVMGHKT